MVNGFIGAHLIPLNSKHVAVKWREETANYGWVSFGLMSHPKPLQIVRSKKHRSTVGMNRQEVYLENCAKVEKPCFIIYFIVKGLQQKSADSVSCQRLIILQNTVLKKKSLMCCFKLCNLCSSSGLCNLFFSSSKGSDFKLLSLQKHKQKKTKHHQQSLHLIISGKQSCC